MPAKTFEDFLGDHSQRQAVIVPKLVTPKHLGVTVRRRGVEVELVIGNSDPITLTWVDAMRLGDEWFREGTAAAKTKRPAELKVKHSKVLTSGRNLQQIGHWLLEKGTEAKALDGEMGKRIETR